MKLFNAARWFQLAALAAVLTPAAAQAQTKFPLVCRGGGTGLTLEHSGRTTRLWFGKIPMAASDPRFPAGVCAWQDRGVAAGEPGRICLDNSSLVFPGFQLGVFGPILNSTFTTPSNSDIDKMLQVIGGGSNTRVTFMVYNDLNGCLRTQ